MRTLRLVIAAVTLSTALACAGELDIVHGLTELEANEILVVLMKQGVSAKKMKEEGRVVTWAVIVPEPDVENALTTLVRNKLPKERSAGLKEVYPPGSSGLIPTKSEEKAKMMMAIQGEIEGKLKSLPGVVKAHVSVVVPDKDIIRDLDTPPPPATASVAIVYNPTVEDEPPINEDQVAMLVAASIEGLKQENVQVLLKRNVPTNLVDQKDDDTQGMMAGEKVLGIKVIYKKSGSKLKGILAVFGVAAGLGVILAFVGIGRSISMKRKLTQAEGQLKSFKKSSQGAEA